jgi:aarF domain-containing kinase
VWNVFPEGMFIDNVVEVAKRELAWEVDYIREAECIKKYRELVAPYPDYYVPAVIGKNRNKIAKCNNFRYSISISISIFR